MSMCKYATDIACCQTLCHDIDTFPPKHPERRPMQPSQDLAYHYPDAASCTIKTLVTDKGVSKKLWHQA